MRIKSKLLLVTFTWKIFKILFQKNQVFLPMSVNQLGSGWLGSVTWCRFLSFQRCTRGRVYLIAQGFLTEGYYGIGSCPTSVSCASLLLLNSNDKVGKPPPLVIELHQPSATVEIKETQNIHQRANPETLPDFFTKFHCFNSICFVLIDILGCWSMLYPLHCGIVHESSLQSCHIPVEGQGFKVNITWGYMKGIIGSAFCPMSLVRLVAMYQVICIIYTEFENQKDNSSRLPVSHWCNRIFPHGSRF